MSASSDLIDRWRAHLALDRRRSVHTLRAYQATAERLVAFLEQHRGEAVTQAMLATLEQADLRAFLTSRRMDGIGNLSAARELSAVRGFLRFVGGEDARPPRLKGPRVKGGLPRPVSPDEAMALAGDIADTARRTGALIRGPIPLPTRIEKFTVNRGPHIDKKSREQFEVRTYKRMLDIVQPTPQTVDALMKLDLAAGVNVEIKLA